MAKKKSPTKPQSSPTKKTSTPKKKATTTKKTTPKKPSQKPKKSSSSKKKVEAPAEPEPTPQENAAQVVVGEEKKRGHPKGSKNAPKELLPPPEQKEFLKGKNVQNVALSSIDLEDRAFQFRGENLRVGPLVESLKAHGQQIPVALRDHPDPNTSNKRYQVISGFRRIEAIKQIGWSKVAAIIRDDLTDDQEAFHASVIENEARKTYNDLDRGRAIVEYRKQGHETKDLSPIFGLRERQLRRLQSLTNFPQVLQDAIDTDQLNATQALILNTACTKHGEKFDLKEWIDRILEENLSVRALNQAIRNEFEQAKKEATFILFQEDTREDNEGNEVRRYLLPRRYIDDPATMDKAEKDRYKSELQRLLDLFD